MAGGGEGDYRVRNSGALHQKQAPSLVIDSARQSAYELLLIASIPNTVAALVRLNIFEALAAAGEGARMTADELAKLAMPGKPINAANLERLLRLVSCKQIVREVVTTGVDGQVERRFELEPIGKFFVEDVENGSFVNLIHLLQEAPTLRSWDPLHEFIIDESITSFARANDGLFVWDYARRNPDYSTMFNKAMAGQSKMYMRAILDAYQGFQDVNVLVDVGGGSGSSLRQITARHPHIKGINFDQPHVIDACPEIPGVTHLSGDFREFVPEGGDAIFMKLILHDWDDESCLRILENCFKALPAHGKVIVVDCILPASPAVGGDDFLGFQFDVTMMVPFGSNARERTESEVRKLALGAGFQQLNVIGRVDHLSITELRKT